MRPIIYCISLLAGCTAGKSTSETAATGTETTSVGVQVLDIEGTISGWWSERMGTDLAFLSDGQLLIGAPSYTMGGIEDQEDDLCWVTAGGEGILADRDASEVVGTVLDDSWGDPDTFPAPRNQFGLVVLSLGDLTGDGVADIAVAGNTGPSTYTTDWGVFPGPDYTVGFSFLASTGSPEGSPCGDLDADGISELCTGDGVYFGPVVEGAVPDLSWTADDPQITGDGPSGLVVSDAAAHAVYRLASLTRAGEVALTDLAVDTWTAANGSATALTVGDLDGDGTDEIVAGWTGEGDDVVLVGLAPGGGDIFASARTTLPVRGDDLAVGDFDGDGQDDLAVGGDSEVTIWLGPLEEGELSIEGAAARYRGPQFPYDLLGNAVAAADTDGDGRSELAIGAPMDNSPEDDEACTPSQGLCSAHGRVWWLSGGGL